MAIILKQMLTLSDAAGGWLLRGQTQYQTTPKSSVSFLLLKLLQKYCQLGVRNQKGRIKKSHCGSQLYGQGK